VKPVIPYELRARRYRELRLENNNDAVGIAKQYLNETDIWLKKILAIKLIAVSDVYEFGIAKEELERSMKCRTR
jgi:hypothetical protein